MSITAKHLHDALLIVQRDIARLENDIKLMLTDVTDNDENFQRRIDNLLGDRSAMVAERDAVNDQIAIIDKEIARMRTARETGHDSINAAKRQIKQLTLNATTINLALLQMEAANV